MKIFFEQISIKFGGFYLNQYEFGSNCAVDKAHQNMVVRPNHFRGMGVGYAIVGPRQNFDRNSKG